MWKFVQILVFKIKIWVLMSKFGFEGEKLFIIEALMMNDYKNKNKTW